MEFEEDPEQIHKGTVTSCRSSVYKSICQKCETPAEQWPSLAVAGETLQPSSLYIFKVEFTQGDTPRPGQGLVYCRSILNLPETKSSPQDPPMDLLFLLASVLFYLGACEAYLNGGTGEPCVGTIHLHTSEPICFIFVFFFCVDHTSSSLTLIRDKRWAFYTDNNNSQYHVAPSRSFSLIACAPSLTDFILRDLCRIVFASPVWRSTCTASKDEEANKKCLRMAEVLHERAFVEPSKTTELWNRAFSNFNRPSTTDALINQSR
ncbi:hypothetical protein VP01_3667g1 [Puccinia sorghi]|uniref:Uncharacterized protein n=1 Tax=Puccinia sorghi TaxID=27349 RepID=A0A0L6UUJ0_9BASI|nr:hypothetical protein VP01_3667g1 [Puccinia sorghi]